MVEFFVELEDNEEYFKEHYPNIENLGLSDEELANLKKDILINHR